MSLQAENAEGGTLKTSAFYETNIGKHSVYTKIKNWITGHTSNHWACKWLYFQQLARVKSGLNDFKYCWEQCS